MPMCIKIGIFFFVKSTHVNMKIGRYRLQRSQYFERRKVKNKAAVEC